MQIVSPKDTNLNVHEISNPVFWEKIKKKYFRMSSAETVTKHAKHQPRTNWFLFSWAQLFKANDVVS